MTKEVVITRTFNAPRELVWKAWSDPELFKQWWGPNGFTAPVCEIDFRVGGKYLNAMRSPEGKDFYGTGTYKEIVPMDRIVYTDSFADEKGNVVPATYYDMTETFPMVTLVTVILEDDGDKTKMTIRHSELENLDPEASADMETGWGQSLDKMAEAIETK